MKFWTDSEERGKRWTEENARAAERLARAAQVSVEVAWERGKGWETLSAETLALEAEAAEARLEARVWRADANVCKAKKAAALARELRAKFNK